MSIWKRPLVPDSASAKVDELFQKTARDAQVQQYPASASKVPLERNLFLRMQEHGNECKLIKGISAPTHEIKDITITPEILTLLASDGGHGFEQR